MGRRKRGKRAADNILVQCSPPAEHEGLETHLSPDTRVSFASRAILNLRISSDARMSVSALAQGFVALHFAAQTCPARG